VLLHLLAIDKLPNHLSEKLGTKAGSYHTQKPSILKNGNVNHESAHLAANEPTNPAATHPFPPKRGTKLPQQNEQPTVLLTTTHWLSPTEPYLLP
jgi:hypothetical protein